MAWAKFDDRWDDNRKVKKAWRGHPRAVAIHAMAITYCARHELDGQVDVEWLHEKLPAAKDYREVVRTLIDAGLFKEIDGETFQVHDFLKYNPSKAQLDARRETDRQRKAAGGRKDSKRTPSGIHAESERKISDSGSPDPTRPGPARPSPYGETTSVLTELRKVPEWAAALTQGADMACLPLIDANRDAPWLELAAEAVSSRLDPGPNSLRTNSPRQALELRLNDHRSGRRGGDYTPGRGKGRHLSPVDHYAAMAEPEG